MYLETVEAVLANTGKVLVDVKNGNNMIYLPLDQIARRGGRVTVQPLNNSQNGNQGSDTGSSDTSGLPSRGTR